ncbi:hypothetical protein GCM10010433_69110 [Streptomyces pulveraceus]|uniref:Uncharacterized protein n=1 Tax=Streptomyces pulveraceus TaxID=68258 RepID=A0ABW1GEV1_9ACTN
MRHHRSPAHALDQRPSSRHAAAELGAALREAGIRVPLARHCAEPQPGRVELGPLSPGEASQLARIVRTGTKRTLRAARALRDIVDAYRLDLPGIQVRNGRIALGSASPATAELLARLLGATAPGPDTLTAAPLDAARVGERLRLAFAAATGGDALDVHVEEAETEAEAAPSAEPVLTLGSIDVATARRLVAALRF